MARKTLGYVADLCPFCRGLQAFRLSQVPGGYEIECQSCKLDLGAEPSTYAAVQKELGDDLGELMRATFPNFHDFYVVRLALEDQLRSGRGVTDPNLRRRIIVETLQVLAPEVDMKLSAKGGGLVASLLGNQRYIQSDVIPKLARALAPLKPTEAELAETLANFRQAGIKIGRAVKAAEVIKAING